ncbi:hypothetical protein EGW08_005797, partial [Elysia chlorotica]
MDSFSGCPLQFLRSLTTFAAIVSRFPERFPASKKENTEEIKNNKARLFGKQEAAENVLNVALGSSDRDRYEGPDDIQAQMSKMWLVVKALCLAVLLLTVAMATLCYKVHTLQCPEMATAGIVDRGEGGRYGDGRINDQSVVSLHQTNQLTSLDETSGPEDTHDTSESRRLRYLDIADQTGTVGQPQLDLRGYDP